MSNVKLAIRLRPFSEREIRNEKDRTQVVSVIDDHTVTITNVKVSASGAGDSRERVRSYSADYTFDSACAPAHPHYASQDTVFNTLGIDVLHSLRQGRGVCVLAYGQSATGKTHTMMGTDAQPGLVSRLCRALAEGPSNVTVSFLEIYNERVHDLLSGDAPAPATCHSLPRRRGNACKDLRVREHPTKGPYVQNLRCVAVSDFETLLSLVRQGTSQRHTAATRRNSSSSRSHALLVITTETAVLHLADLAGSEKASWEGCGGGRQKEGANINKSLVALSNVISALVSGGGNRARFVPYRDSALTWLLKDCFTGGAQTFIIATVSPSVSCYGETASTLRWAASARQLPTLTQKAASHHISSAVLQKQYDGLLAELGRHHIRYIAETGNIVYEDEHWSLNGHRNELAESAKEETVKIGNILKMLKPKTDADISGSTPSSVASGSSDKINKMDSAKLTEAINKEVDKMFPPSLERTSSGSNLKVIAPLRNKRRQYKSQEVLPVDISRHPNTRKTTEVTPELTENSPKISTPVPILYDHNQRAEIVASVTERLYSKLKKKEETAMAKVESAIDKKIMEPLSELKICTNARQRLVELSQKALKNKRRIGIPAYTQTRKLVIRVKDQAVDAQKDLQYYANGNEPNAVHCDAQTETVNLTPRCKEISIGCVNGSVFYSDKSTMTDMKQAIRHDSAIETDRIDTSSQYTQTPILPPPRRKRRTLYCLSCSKHKRTVNYTYPIERTVPPVININITQPYAESSQSSDDNGGNVFEPANVDGEYLKATSVTTPDLLTNHSTMERIDKDDIKYNVRISNCHENEPSSDDAQVKLNDFSEHEDCALPRVTMSSLVCENKEDFKNIIFGRNGNEYPYNILLSPPRERDSLKRVVKFKDDDDAKTIDASEVSASSWEWENKSDVNAVSDQDVELGKISNPSMCSDSSENSKTVTNPRSYEDEREPRTSPRIKCIPVYKGSTPSQKHTRSTFYRQLLGLQQEDENCKNCAQCTAQSEEQDSLPDTEPADSLCSFKQNQRFFEDKIKSDFVHSSYSYDYMENKLLESCNDLEKAVKNYEQSSTRKRNRSYRGDGKRTPTEYLQHLVQIRRDMIKSDFETDSSMDYYRK